MSVMFLNSILPFTPLAVLLAASETQALAIDLTDSFWQPSTGHYGSAYVLDTGTPANNYNSHPYGLLSYTSPSAKMTLGPTGTLRFGAHNLYLNSASPANQSITVVSGATYSVDITGSVSITASGAATGTWTAGSNTFTAATTTLTLGSTSGSGTVVVRRTPSDSTYLATTSAARYALPFEWDTSGNLLGILVEEARTNLCLYSDDLTNAAWTKSNLTTAKTATGPDGVANSATTITATAGNATALQAITSAGAVRVTSVWLKRRTGTGNIDVTQNNGTTWATKSITSSWARYSIAAETWTNPTVGIRVVTSGDAVDVALFDHEVGSFITSAIPTLGSTVTRAVDNISLATSAFPHSATSGTIYAHVTSIKNTTGPFRVVQLNNNNSNTFFDRYIYNGYTSTEGQSLDIAFSGTILRTAAAYAANDIAASDNGSAAVADATYTTGTQTVLQIGNSSGSTQYPNCHINQIMYLPRRMTNVELQALTA